MNYRPPTEWPMAEHSRRWWFGVWLKVAVILAGVGLGVYLLVR